VPNFLPHLPGVLRLRASLGYSKQRREKLSQSRRPAVGCNPGCRAALHSVRVRPGGVAGEIFKLKGEKAHATSCVSKNECADYEESFTLLPHFHGDAADSPGVCCRQAER